MGPTGEHDSPVLELSGSDLEPVAGSNEGTAAPIDPQAPALAPDEDGPTLQPGPAAQLFHVQSGPPGPLDRTLPPTPRFEPVGEDPLDALDPMDNAPTRIEREEDILANIDGAPQQAAGPRLLIIGGNNRGREFTLNLGDNSIGRGTDNDVVLADIAVSRKHTLVCYETDHFVVRDLGSGNGTLLNGKKVSNHPLQDGDQLELGNTLMRFLCPTAPAQLAHMSTVITHREEVPGGAQHTLDVRPQVTMTARPVDGGLFSARSRRLLVFGGVGLVVFLGAMIGLKLVISSKRQQQAAAAAKPVGPKPDELVLLEFNEGIKQYNARNWAEARQHFHKVLALAPNQRPAIHRYITVTETEQAAREALDKARGLLASRRYNDARSQVAKVQTSSLYYSESRTLVKKIDDDEVTQLLDTARALRDTDASAALEKVKEAQRISSSNKAVRDLYEELSKARSKVAVKTKTEPAVRPDPKRRPDTKHKTAHKPEPRTKPEPKTPEKAIKVSGNAAKNAVAQYKKRQFGPAVQLLKEFAATQKGKKQKSALSLAETMRQVGQAWTRAEQMENSNPAQALRYYEEAAKADLKIEKGVHQKVLKEKLFKTAKAKATTALQRKQNSAAYDAVKVAEKYGKRDASLQTVIDTLQKRAQALFDQAYTMRSNGNIAGARKLWQQILHMVPPSAPVYKKAYDWLNSSGPGHTDEDED